MPFSLEKITNADVAVKRRNYSPSEVKQVHNARSKKTVNLSLAFSLLSTEGEAEDEERRGVGLLSVGQVGAKYQQLACASSLNYRLFN